MSNRSFISSTVVFLGGLLAVVTQFLLPPCSAWIETASGMHIPMKCHWSGQMVVSLGLFIVFEGILLGMMKSVFARLGLSLVVIVTAILTMAVPTVLIGVCAGGTMPCRVGMLPAILVVCVLLLLVGLGNVFYLRIRKESCIAFPS